MQKIEIDLNGVSAEDIVILEDYLEENCWKWKKDKD